MTLPFGASDFNGVMHCSPTGSDQCWNLGPGPKAQVGVVLRPDEGSIVGLEAGPVDRIQQD
jgi:hypothetical protein